MEYRFAQFRFEPHERRLLAHGKPVEVSSRYLDALALLLSERGKLVNKARFMDEVWAGVPVTDEALTQAIRALRKALGDDAANPRFIETVPKHGYRFVGTIDDTERDPVVAGQAILPVVLAAAMGGGLAGLLGGAAFGAAGGGSLLLVLAGLTGLLGLVGGGAIGLGLGIARRLAPPGLATDALGAAAGGLIVGAMARLFGIDAFTVLLGVAPTEMTGASEGLLLGAATGLALHVRLGPAWLRGTLLGGAAGGLMALAGGRLMAGSLAVLELTLPDNGLTLDWLALVDALSGRVLVTALEGALFVALVTLALARMSRTST